jgi:hypothetical protein
MSRRESLVVMTEFPGLPWRSIIGRIHRREGSRELRKGATATAEITLLGQGGLVPNATILLDSSGVTFTTIPALLTGTASGIVGSR